MVKVTGDTMLKQNVASLDVNPYEAFFNKEITLEEFAALIGLEPHLVILHLKELIAEYENRFNFIPSLALYNLTADLYHEYTQLDKIDETHDRIHLKINVADSIRKAAKTIDELKRVRQSSQTVVIQNINQMNVSVIENFVNRLTPYLCPECQSVLLEKYDELVRK